MKIRNKLRILMAEHRYNIQDVSDKTGISRNTISKLYNEKSTNIAFDTIVKLCDLFNCKVGDLFYLENAPKD